MTVSKIKEELLDSLGESIDLEDVPTAEEACRLIAERIRGGAVISYGQNREDVILNRVLGDCDTGCYVDVGAFHPSRKSLTKLFYDRGWRGLNVDVCPQNIEAFLRKRPDDTNVCAAVGAEPGTAKFFMVPNSTRSTVLSSLGEDYRLRGIEVEERETEVVTLDGLFEQYRITEVDFLSVDVEGAEKSVLEGLSFDAVRPKVLVIEATYPETDVPNWEEWEPLLIERDYLLAGFDGLNRFYVSRECESLLERFELPPNYFDDFVSYELVLNVLGRVM